MEATCGIDRGCSDAVCVCGFPPWRHGPHRPKALSERTHTVEQPQLPSPMFCVSNLGIIFSQASNIPGPKDVLKVPRVSEDEHHQLPGLVLFRADACGNPAPILRGRGFCSLSTGSDQETPPPALQGAGV